MGLVGQLERPMCSEHWSYSFSFLFTLLQYLGGYTSSNPIRFIGPLTTGAKVPSLSSKVALSTVSLLLANGLANVRAPMDSRKSCVFNYYWISRLSTHDFYPHHGSFCNWENRYMCTSDIKTRDLLDVLNRRVQKAIISQFHPSLPLNIVPNECIALVGSG